MTDHDEIHFLDSQMVALNDLSEAGTILDLGGGGEGVIGQLMGDQVVAIDPSTRELEEAPDGPLKIVMDARELKFLDSSFSTVTAFFTLMYIPVSEHLAVFAEVFRVLSNGGRFLIWDAELPLQEGQDTEIVAFYLTINLPGTEIKTGYGTKWPAEALNLAYYRRLAESVGFKVCPSSSVLDDRVFLLELVKELSN